MDQEKNTTHFGYQQIPENDKVNLVEAVFRSVAPKYDLMNDLMSFGLHRWWKKRAISLANLRPGQKILDVASGTGDLAAAFSKIVGNTGLVMMTDINDAMLRVGRERLIDRGIVGNVQYCLANAEHLPFADNSFNCVSIAFGLRNVTDKQQALNEMYRVIKPGGKLIVLEFSHPTHNMLDRLYDFYSFNFIPKLGELITQDKASYQYLVESIRMHPPQEELLAMVSAAGFEDAQYENLTGGIVAIHYGYKY